MTYRGRRDVHTTAELEAATGVGYRTLRRWVLAGLLPAPTKHGRGLARGVVALWSADALRLARAAAELRKQGWPLDVVKRRLLEQRGPAKSRRR